MARIAPIVTYLVGTAVAIVLLNADIHNESLALAIWAVVSVLLGCGTGRLSFALLAFLAIPFAVPFGHQDQYLGGEPPALWWLATFYAFISASLIFATALIKQVVDGRRHWRSSA